MVAPAEPCGESVEVYAKRNPFIPLRKVEVGSVDEDLDGRRKLLR
jgi:hypothetical protein